jgi:4-amino-4-deoxy-L-arabinose transferase-like glycosyltransferase
MANLQQEPPRTGIESGEVLNIAVLSIAGAILRLWGLPRLGLNHFDEGIYVLAGLWPFSRDGVASLGPTLIPYAPPAYPICVGLNNLALGISDLTAILVSVLAGTVTIPATAWLAHRTFGAGAGAAAAALVAVSGFHIAFSRMALTDASFLLCWVVGLVCAQRFLERPGLGTALGLGLSVGLAQLFKYNGWLLGAIVIIAGCLGAIVNPQERCRERILKTLAAGLLAALLAALIYAPWFRFVDAHGGYGRLLAHHRSYIGGSSLWLPQLLIQEEQADALSGGPVWKVAQNLAAFAGCCLALRPRGGYRGLVCCAIMPVLILFVLLPDSYGLIGVGWITWASEWSPGRRLLACAWLILSVLTPFYHPYARLWLPLQSVGWVITAGVVAASVRLAEPQARLRQASFDHLRSLRRLPLTVCGLLLCVFYLWTALPLSREALNQILEHHESPLQPTDSLRATVRTILADLPTDPKMLRLLARPPVTFYLGGRIPTRVEPDLTRLIEQAGDLDWALVDEAQLRQEGDTRTATAKLLQRWEIVRAYPARLTLPTLLDVDPAAVRSGLSDAFDAPLLLLRPRTFGKTP